MLYSRATDTDAHAYLLCASALEHDIAWLAEFHATRQAGDINTIAASPAEIEAASILVELLLGKKRTAE